MTESLVGIFRLMMSTLLVTLRLIVFRMMYVIGGLRTPVRKEASFNFLPLAYIMERSPNRAHLISPVSKFLDIRFSHDDHSNFT